MSYANNKGADQPAHQHSLIIAFIVHCLDSIIPLVSISEISSLYLTSVAAQAGLCHLVANLEDRFSRDEAHSPLHQSVTWKFLSGMQEWNFFFFQTHPSVRIKGTENNYIPSQCFEPICMDKSPHMHCPFCVKTDCYTDPVILKAHYRVKHVDKGIEFAGKHHSWCQWGEGALPSMIVALPGAKSWQKLFYAIW